MRFSNEGGASSFVSFSLYNGRDLHESRLLLSVRIFSNNTGTGFPFSFPKRCDTPAFLFLLHTRSVPSWVSFLPLLLLLVFLRDYRL